MVKIKNHKIEVTATRNNQVERTNIKGFVDDHVVNTNFGFHKTILGILPMFIRKTLKYKNKTITLNFVREDGRHRVNSSWRKFWVRFTFKYNLHHTDSKTHLQNKEKEVIMWRSYTLYQRINTHKPETSF